MGVFFCLKGEDVIGFGISTSSLWLALIGIILVGQDVLHFVNHLLAQVIFKSGKASVPVGTRDVEKAKLLFNTPASSLMRHLLFFCHLV